jgi:hypothetical protein
MTLDVRLGFLAASSVELHRQALQSRAWECYRTDQGPNDQLAPCLPPDRVMRIFRQGFPGFPQLQRRGYQR